MSGREGAVGQLSVSESEQLIGSHLILQLILSVHLMLSDVEVVSGVVVHGLYKAEKDNNISVIGAASNVKCVSRMTWTRTKTADEFWPDSWTCCRGLLHGSYSQFIE